MVLVVIAAIFFIIKRKDKTEISEPVEPVIQKVTLSTGTVKNAVVVKGAVKVGSESAHPRSSYHLWTQPRGGFTR